MFEEWVRDLDSKFEQEQRKVALTVDNCQTHLEIGGLKSAQTFF